MNSHPETICRAYIRPMTRPTGAPNLVVSVHDGATPEDALRIFLTLFPMYGGAPARVTYCTFRRTDRTHQGMTLIERQVCEGLLSLTDASRPATVALH